MAPSESKPPSVPGLIVYDRWRLGHTYVVGADPAEGNPQSDDSAFEVLDVETGEEVARLAGRIEPAVFASYIDLIGVWFNRADVLVERNNHGHTVILWLREHSRLKCLVGLDGHAGWLTNTKNKAAMYAIAAEACRDQETIIHSLLAFTQLASIEGGTLRAPEGQKDDVATGYALALVGITRVERRGGRVFRAAVLGEVKT